MSAILRCIAIDDEPIALDVINAHAGKVPFLDLRRTSSMPSKPWHSSKVSQST